MKHLEVPNKPTLVWFKDLHREVVESQLQTNSDFLKECKEWYAMFDGKLVEQLYASVLRPYENEESPLAKKLFQNFSLIRPLILSMAGDYASMPSQYTISTINPDSELIRETAMVYFKTEAVNQALINQLEKNGVQTGMPTNPVDLNKINETFDLNYIDNLAAVGQEIINIKDDHLDGIRKDLDLITNWLISGFKAEHFYLFGDETRTEVLTPDRIDVLFDAHSNNIEDAKIARVRTNFTLNDAIIRYFNSDNIKALTDKEKTIKGSGKSGISNPIREDKVPRAIEITINRVYVTCRRKIKRISYTNIFGDQQVKDVSLDYKLDPTIGDIDEEVIAVKEIWYYDYIDGEQLEKGLLEYGRVPMFNKKVAIPIIGKLTDNSICKRAKYYEITHNILMLDLIMTLRKFDVMTFIPKVLRDDKVSPAKWFRTGKNGGIYWIDWSPQISEALRDIKSVIPDGNIIEVKMKAIDMNLNLFNKAIGWSDVASGDANPYIGKAVANQMLQRTTRSNLPALLDFTLSEAKSKMLFIPFAIKNWGKDGSIYSIYQNRILRKFGFSENELKDIDFLIKAVDASAELDKIQMVINILQPALQNASSAEEIMTLALEAIEQTGRGGSFAKLKLVAKRIAVVMQNVKDKEQQAMMQNQQAIAQMQADSKQATNQVTLQAAQVAGQAKVQAASIQADADLQQAIIEAQVDLQKIQTDEEIKQVYDKLLNKIKDVSKKKNS